MEIKTIFKCNENFNQMSPTDQGRFCNKCCKEVIDLVGKKPDQVPSGTFCGRYQNNTEKTASISYQRFLLKSSLWKYVLLSLTLFYTKFAGATDRHNKTPKTAIDSMETKLDSLQTIEIKGVVTDRKTRETIPFAVLVLEAAGKQAGSAQSNVDGEYSFKISLTRSQMRSLVLRTVVLGYEPLQVTEIPGKNSIIDIKLKSQQFMGLGIVIMVQYKTPLISTDQPSGYTFEREDVEKAGR